MLAKGRGAVVQRTDGPRPRPTPMRGCYHGSRNVKGHQLDPPTPPLLACQPSRKPHRWCHILSTAAFPAFWIRAVIFDVVRTVTAPKSREVGLMAICGVGAPYRGREVHVHLS